MKFDVEEKCTCLWKKTAEEITVFTGLDNIRKGDFLLFFLLPSSPPPPSIAIEITWEISASSVEQICGNFMFRGGEACLTGPGSRMLIRVPDTAAPAGTAGALRRAPGRGQRGDSDGRWARWGEGQRWRGFGGDRSNWFQINW